MKKIFLFFVVYISLMMILNAQMDKSHFTTIGEIGLTVTNCGVLGEGYKNSLQPSCMYKQYAEDKKEQVEHMSYGGLWIGGKLNGEKRVTTAIKDGVYSYGGQGFEFTDTGDTVLERSSLLTSPSYSPYAVSPQDFVTTYHDTGNIVDHNPLYIQVEQTSYAWDNDYADDFVMVNYHISNIGQISIQDVYVGFWADVAVGNMNYTSIYVPGGGWNWYDNLNGFDETIFNSLSGDSYSNCERDIAYSYDIDGDNGYAKSYVGFTFLGSSTVIRKHWDTYYNQWKWNTASNDNYPPYFMPLTDAERYDKLCSSVPKGTDNSLYNNEGYPSERASWVLLVSAGPFGSVPVNPDSSSWELPAGESFDVTFAVLCGQWAQSSTTDSPERRELLHVHADWAQRVYNGEDVNGNERLDTGEDLNDNGLLDRYLILDYTSIDNDDLLIPDDFRLYSSYPNPFNPTATISYSLFIDTPVDLSIYDISGKKICTLIKEYQSSGFYKINWDASEFGSGIYFYRLKTGNLVDTKKMVLVK